MWVNIDAATMIAQHLHDLWHVVPHCAIFPCLPFDYRVALRSDRYFRFRWTQIQLEDFFSSSTSRPRLHTQEEVNDKLERLDNRVGVVDLDLEYERVYCENTDPGNKS